MTIRIEQWLLDTNVWIFGLCRDQHSPDCTLLLDQIGCFSIVIPRQVLKELSLNLTQQEMTDFYELVKQYSEFVELSWEPEAAEKVESYRKLGCKKGDAVIAAHAESLNVDLLVTDNRQFLKTITDQRVTLVTPRQALARLPSPHA